MTNQILSGAPEESAVVQPSGSVTPSRIGLSEAARHKAVAALNRLLAHAMAICDLYKKAHWQASGAQESRIARAPRGDDGTNDLIVADVVRRNELQSWFVGEHLASHAG